MAGLDTRGVSGGARVAQGNRPAVIARQRLRVSGVVQGVGFRPFVWRLAHRLGLRGDVRNVDGVVLIDAQGDESALRDLRAALTREAPPLARLSDIDMDALTVETQTPDFRIAASIDDRAVPRDDGALPVDSVLCPACLGEIFDPDNRRYRYGLNACCDCGPRYTITRRLPYDRANTSMSDFALCSSCAAEYADPHDRRFHAELIGCPQCGPTLRYERLGDQDGSIADPITQAWQSIARGEIIAVQGLGGFQLICDAANVDAVARLRARKRRPAKPLALLTLNEKCAARWAECSDDARDLLTSPARPVVVVPRNPGVNLEGIAPGLNHLGLMLPCTPIQFLLFHEAMGRPVGVDWLNRDDAPLLVATSANVSDDPIEIDPEHARSALVGIADAMLSHDRAIVARCDDSVVLPAETASLPRLWLRRARGCAPQSLALPHGGASVLALGAHQKSTVTLTIGNRAFVSPYIGDLGSPNTCEALQAMVGHFIDLCRTRPAVIACDLQPDLYSTQLAHDLAARWEVPVLPVQHHHAHIAAVLGEHGHTGAALGLALDGFGWGDDGGAWGGELLRVEAGRAQRLGHLTPLPLPGGDLAARQPARMALALLHTIGSVNCPPNMDTATAARLREQIERDFNCPSTTSLGRWFDAIAGLAGLGERQSYSGEAAMKLEALACPAAALP
ncbi:MAG: carbamoyltransferase HypF, partial [Gallionellaceae bacterium]|nr:carbamoyltransferase HypF [Gallionellaceae bacterium]